MRVAVTGGSGQLGTLVLRRLADDRAVKEIVAIDLQPPLIVSGKIRSVAADIRGPLPLEGCDALIHLAFLVAKRGARELQHDVNVRGSANVFDAAVKAGVPRILYASSVAAYGVVPGLPVPVLEATPRTRQPGFWYACAKFDVEAILDQLPANVSVTRFRPAILIGRRMEHQLGAAMRRGYFPEGGSMPVVWDEDVADAFLLALHKGASGAFNVAADEPLPARELAKAAGLKHLDVPRGALRAVEKIVSGLRLLPPADPGWLAKADFPLVYSSEKARRELGWKPRFSTAREVLAHWAETVPRKLDPRIAVFVRVVDRAARAEKRPELTGYDSTVHLDLTGPGGGDFTIRAADGIVRVTPGAPRPAQAAVTMKAVTLLDLLSGRTDFAAANLAGRVRVDGQGLAGMLVAGMVEGFRAAGRKPGLRGLSARGLARWMAGQ